jgi:hypothetical protein
VAEVWFNYYTDSNGEYRALPEVVKQNYRQLARAAIAAMRHPTEAMRLAIPLRLGDLTIRDVGDIWRSMIDAALATPPPEQ